MGKKNKHKTILNTSNEEEEKITVVTKKAKKDHDHSNTTCTNTNNTNNVKKDIDEIDELFAIKKETQNAHRKQEQEEEKKREEQRQLYRRNNSKNSSSINSKNAKNIDLAQDRSDVQKLTKGEWANDGLGGVFDKEGFTGRTEDGTGFKIYKAHLFNKKGFGTTPDCPFDCDCCYI